MTDPDHGVAVGSRLAVGRHGAVIRYIGPVDGQEGTWVGLEWDDPSRGKHDGTHAGRRYFSCVRHPSAGSLVRLAKLIATADAGCSLEAAIQARYKSGEDGSETNDEAYVSTASHRRVPIRLVGAAAAAAVACADGALEAASFVDMRISSLDTTPSVIAFLNRIVSLDLSNNLLASWPAVAAAAAALPSLRSLNLSGNLLELGDLDAVRAAPRVPSLRTMVLNGCGVGWAAAAAVAAATPSLAELHLNDNGIYTLSLGDIDNSAFSSLESLDLENNRLSDWADVAAALAGLPRLRTLLLGCNDLKEVGYSGEGFQALQQVALGGNSINAWATVDALDRFPALIDVRLSDNPLYAAFRDDAERENGADGEVTPPAGASNARFETVARISKLKVLNGGEISAGERWDSELAYLRRITDEAAVAEASGGATARAAALAPHPRFASLVQKYGELTAAVPEAAKGTTLAASMVELTLVGPGGKKVVKKKVPATLTVGKLKPVLERVLRLKLAHQTLALTDPSGAVTEDVTAQDGRELRLYGVGDGWRVEVGERDAASAAAARNAAAEEQERRMAEHEAGLQRLRDEEERLMGGGKG